MIDYDKLINQARDKKFRKLESNSVEWECYYDDTNGHVEYTKDNEPVPCTNRYQCPLNPEPSRYKEILEAEKMKVKERDTESRQIPFDTTVMCDHKPCSHQNPAIDDGVSCYHGHAHPKNDSCHTGLCLDYPSARCMEVKP